MAYNIITGQFEQGPTYGGTVNAAINSPLINGTSTAVGTGAAAGAVQGIQAAAPVAMTSGPVTSPQPQQPSAPSGPSPDDILNQGYNDYLGQLDNMLGSLQTQSGAMTTQAQEATNQQQGQLDLQNTQGQNTLNQYQSRTLKDIGQTIGNGFRAGNVLLGSMGAGDSSAANQYAYALAKEGSKQRGGVMQDVSQRLGNLQMVYNTAKNDLQSKLRQQIAQISQWFSSQQMQLQGMKAEAAKERSQQLLSYATQQLSMAQSQALGMQNALNTWVANNATSIQSAQQMMQQNVANNPVPQAMNTQPQSTIASAAPTMWSYSNDTTKNKLFT